MTSPSLSQPDIKALEQTRQKLFQLTKHLSSLQTAIAHSDPLPSWPTLQNTATIISTNLLTLSTHLQTHRALFNSTVVYPLPSFPGQSQESLLQHLLRKKLEPRVEDWVEHGRAVGLACEAITPDDGSGRKTELTTNELVELWEWAGRAANEEAKRRSWGDDEEFTLEEKEGGVSNVVTGLRRRLEFNEDEGEAEGDVEMGDAASTEESKEPGDKKAVPNGIVPLRLEEILRFVSTGALPGSSAPTAAATTGVNPLKRGRLGLPFGT